MSFRALAARNLIAVMFAGLAAQASLAQTTAFDYQGSLKDSGVPANGSFQMQFKLFDSLGGAGQIGSTIPDVPVTASQGIFSVKLDFGASPFTGADRWLEIAVRHNAGEAYTTLSPREQIASSPYSVRTLSAASADNALNLGGVAASQYLQANGSGANLTNLNAGSITTGTLSNARLGQIPNANIADSAVTSPKIAGGQVVKSVNTLKDDVTLAAGSNVTITPVGNTLTIAATGGGGGNAILNQTTLQSPANFNISGDGFVGGSVGIGTTMPISKLNVATVGYGFTQTDGSVAVGSYVNTSGGWYGTKSNHPLFFFTNNSSPRMTLDTSGRFGVGTPSPTAQLTVEGSGAFDATNAARFDLFNTAAGTGFLQHVTDDGTWQIATTGGATRMVIDPSGNVGIGTATPAASLGVVGSAIITGSLYVGSYVQPASGPDLCAGGAFPTFAGTIGICAASSLRYKTDVQSFYTGLEAVKKLRPVTFRWKKDGVLDLGLIAEEVAEVEPLLAFSDNKGEIAGVRYRQLNMLLINAVKEQQKEIEQLKEAIGQLSEAIGRLK